MPTFFRCSKGRREFDPFESAIACEESHREVVTAKAKQYTVSPYPFMIAGYIYRWGHEGLHCR